MAEGDQPQAEKLTPVTPASGESAAIGALALAQQLGQIKQPPAPEKSGLGARSRTQQLTLRHMAFRGIALKLSNDKQTDFDDQGGFVTKERSNHLVLPSGVRIAGTEDVAFWCCKFRHKGQLKYCGPQTKDSVILCARCNAPLCRRHAWQFLFSKSRFCSWCLFVRAVEFLLTLAFFVFKLFGLIARGLGNAWFRAYR